MGGTAGRARRAVLDEKSNVHFLHILPPTERGSPTRSTGTSRAASWENAAATVNESDLRGLRKPQSAAGKRFGAGVVLYDGSATVSFGGALFAVPVRKLWEAA